MSQREAYKTTFNCKKMTDEQIDSEASAMLNATGRYKNRPKASQRYKALITEIQKQDNENAIASGTEVMRYWTSVMRGEAHGETVVVEGTGKGYSKARNMTKRPDEKEKLKASELLGKCLGLFEDKQDEDIQPDDGFIEALKGENVWQQ